MNEVYRVSIVRWPLFVGLAIFFGVVICASLKNNNDDLSRFVIISLSIFLSLYIAFNFDKAHGGNKRLINVAVLYGVSKNQKPTSVLKSKMKI
jgi:hypothetical protein